MDRKFRPRLKKRMRLASLIEPRMDSSQEAPYEDDSGDHYRNWRPRKWPFVVGLGCSDVDADMDVDCVDDVVVDDDGGVQAQSCDVGVVGSGDDADRCLNDEIEFAADAADGVVILVLDWTQFRGVAVEGDGES